MGSKLSKDGIQSSSVVMIVLGGGKKETYSRPVSAQEVMLRHPQHVLIHLDVRDPDFKKTIVTAETVLRPGSKYFLVLRRTVEWLMDQHMAMSFGGLSEGINYFSDHDIEIESTKHLNRSLSDVLRLPSKDWMATRSPWRFADEQGCLDKERGKWSKFPSHMSPKSPLPKSPTESNEINQRPWRSSLKGCPREDDPLWDKDLSEVSLSTLSQVGAGEDELHGHLDEVNNDGGRLCSGPQADNECQLIVTDTTCKKEFYASDLVQESSAPVETCVRAGFTNCFLRLSEPFTNQTSGGFGDKHGEEIRRNMKFLLKENTVDVNRSFNSFLPSKVGISLQKVADIPHGNVSFLEEEAQKECLLEHLKCPCPKQQQQLISTPADELKEMDIVDISVEEAFESKNCHAGIKFNPEAKDDALPMQAMGNVVIDLEEELASKVPCVNQLYYETEISKSSPANEGPQSRVPAAPLHKNRSSIPPGSPLVSSLYRSASPDQPKEGCASTLLKTVSETSTFQLVVVPHVGMAKEPGSFGNEEDWDCKAVDVGGSSEDISTREVSAPQVQTLRDVIFRCSPDYPELIDGGFSSSGMPPLLGAPLPSSVAPSGCLSSPSVLRMSSSKAFLPSPSPSPSPLPSTSTSEGSLFLLMDRDSSKQQGNLHLLGFNSFTDDRLSIYEQAKAHTRTQRIMMGKWSKVKNASSSSIKVKQECLSPENVKGQEAWRPSTGHHCGSHVTVSLRVIREKLLRPLKKHPLSPIPELSPELSPASLPSLIPSQ